MAQAKTKSNEKETSNQTEKPLAQVIDDLILKGCNPDTVLERVNEQAEERDLKPYTEGRLKAHVRFRLDKDEQFYGKVDLDKFDV